jgi:hypothetical protein
VESARGAQEQMRAAEDLREIPPEDRPQDVLGCHSCYERGRAKTSTSVMITRRFQYRSVSAHRSLACGSRVSQDGWAVAAEHLGLFEVDRVTRGGVHPEYPARRDLLVLPTATFRAATGRDAKGDPDPCREPWLSSCRAVDGSVELLSRPYLSSLSRLVEADSMCLCVEVCRAVEKLSSFVELSSFSLSRLSSLYTLSSVLSSSSLTV